jgi:signal transduction histidine kinase/CheY-like chemotaxis protein/ABC-type amino acid transport substrate-binding protein/CRISPR/Cas system-associated protein endoribonuclease Cas2
MKDCEQRGKRRALLCAVSVAILAACAVLAGGRAFAKEPVRTVKVGYFAMDGYNEIGEDGRYSGYDYDFFQLLGRYTSLNFEYVGYDKSWQEMLEMLDDGEIDILTSIHITEDRQQKYDFSYDIGNSYTMLTVKMGNNRFQSGDYASYDGMKVGMLRESSQNDVFDTFAKENDFAYKPIYFDTATQLSEAVQSGEIDAAVTSNLRKLNGERVIEKIQTSRFYAAVRKGDTELLEEIDQGITQMDLYEGDWRNSLYYTYYGYQGDAETEITYSEREQAFFAEYSEGENVLQICFNPVLAPYSYVENGKMVGILPDAIGEMMDSLGLQYEYVVTGSYDEYRTLYENGGADIFPEIVENSSALAQQNYLFTDSYYTMRVGLLTKKAGYKGLNVIAVPGSQSFYDASDFPDAEVKTYDSNDALVEAVVRGDVDAAFLMNYTAQMYVNRETLGELAYVSQPDLYYDISFAVNRDTPHELCSILNKNIDTVVGRDLDSLSISYIENDLQHLTPLEYLQLNPQVTFLIFGFFVALVVVVLILIFSNIQKTREKKVHEQYRHAVLSDAFVVYDANISKNLMKEDVIEQHGDDKFSVMEVLGLTAPCSYDEYMENIYARLAEEKNRVLFEEKTNRAHLLAMFEQGRTEEVFECRTNLMGGLVCDIRHTIYLTKTGRDGDIIAHVNIKDVSKQKENERQMHKYEQIFVATATENYKGVRRVDLNTHQAEYIYFSDGQILQYELGDWDAWLNRQQENIHPDDFERVAKTFSTPRLLTMEEGVQLRQDYRSKKTNEKGVHRVYTTTAYVMYMEEQKVAIMTTMDNTAAVENEMEQKKLIEDALQLAEQANKAKTVFLSNMSHDIRTPMNAIIGFTTLAKMHMDNTEQISDYLEKIDVSSAHLLSLINDVLDMSRIESGRIHIDEAECDLSEVIRNLNSMLSVDMQEKGLDFSISTEGLRHEKVICDRTCLNQVLLNLMGNAMKFTPADGSVRLQITEKSMEQTENDSEGKAIYEFRVTDTGIGMSEEFMEHVFEPFERERNSTVSGIQGTGLGMSITKNIVEMMGGTISVTSLQGKGTEFVVCLPMKQVAADGEVIAAKAETVKADRRNIKGQRVLLVEDNEINREIAVEILSDADLVVEEAEDGSLAVDRLLEKGAGYYKLVLMDIQMPIMDGYTATRTIRSFEDKELAGIPIVAMTANAFDEDRKKAMEAGMNAHIAKPINVDMLLDTLEQLFRTSERADK